MTLPVGHIPPHIPHCIAFNHAHYLYAFRLSPGLILFVALDPDGHTPLDSVTSRCQTCDLHSQWSRWCQTHGA